VSIEFNLLTVNQVEGTNNSLNGSLILCGEKYRLNLKDNIIWFDGETSWNYLPDEKEVTITSPDKNDDSFLNHPSLLFSWYKKGYKTRLLEEKAGAFIIDLYPEDINSDHIRIRLNLSNPALDLKSLEYKYKNGITITVNVISYDLKQKHDDAAFVFSPEKYKGVEIIDMR
jgi:outer membrane lipoprotein-sorting protein